ncbi:beta-lactamase family protein [Dyadobacter sp. CY261]|uniref:serine hydrolase domain-containing protein n=1 Tax=Dyadobacter sp. CY261 TaxID=2907203 RepID=UPI001F339D20|nr:serine hydrolase domain-containing protein [Dyadobacter sp. CY261]MCF0069295.1 beta-lactamase family protein [Dyadobacter sp. CY261]
MRQLFTTLFVLTTVFSCGQKNTPQPLPDDPNDGVDTGCTTCIGKATELDSTPIPIADRDIRSIFFKDGQAGNLPDVSPLKYWNRLEFYKFLRSHAKDYDNDLMVYIGRRDTTEYCFRQGQYNADTKLPIMSASKAVTASVIMSIIESGKLKLDDKVSKYVPSFNNEKKDITLRQLMSHTSGIVVESRFDSRSDLTLAQNVDSIALRTALLFTPGKQALYGSVAFAVASRMAEVVEKKPWAQIFQERIGSKVGMKDVVYSPNHPANPETGYGIVCSMNEYLRFLTMIYNKGTYNGVRVLKEESIALMEQDNTNKVDPTYGLGLFRYEIQNGVATEVACLSAKGIHAWINRSKNYYGLIFTQAGFEKTILTNLAFRDLVRQKL